MEKNRRLGGEKMDVENKVDPDYRLRPPSGQSKAVKTPLICIHGIKSV